nr:MAG: RNA-dependent RNA polymerase [Aspergillus flavus deltaflexivirus 1]
MSTQPKPSKRRWWQIFGGVSRRKSPAPPAASPCETVEQEKTPPITLSPTPPITPKPEQQPPIVPKSVHIRVVAGRNQAHHAGCRCDKASPHGCYSSPDLEMWLLALDLVDIHARYGACPARDLCTCKSKGGRVGCKLTFIRALGTRAKFGATYRLPDFDNSPQRHALLNRHLIDYWNGRQRTYETTPYNIPESQRHLLQDLGMERPAPDAPEVPHALHKCIEEGMLRRLRRVLPPHQYGIISVKDSKLQLLPPAASVQNPVFEAKDVTRYPGTAVPHANLREHSLYLMHDVSSVVYPHELVEKLVSENPEAHLFVTGMNPAEVLDGNQSWEPASHTIEYDLGNFNYVFTGSESESYFTSCAVTKSWLRTSSIVASNGRTYHVTLLEYKLGHCLWHIYCGEAEDNCDRTFPTYSMIRVPAVVSGSFRDEYLPCKLITGVCDFVRRTPDLSTRNIAAKSSALAAVINPRATARERWVATYLAEHLAPHKHLWWYVKTYFWKALYAVTLQWQMLNPMPDLYNYVDERKRCRTVHATQGGGWSPRVKTRFVPKSIPNCPSMLQRWTALSSSIFSWLWPKMIIGEALVLLFHPYHYFSALKWLYLKAELGWERTLLTLTVAAVMAIVPGSVLKIFSRLSGHYWRQLWLPGWVSTVIQRALAELTGAPGAEIFMYLPGRGYFYQLWIWMLGAYSILPGLKLMWVVPWYAFTISGLWLPFAVLTAFVLLENVLAVAPKVSVCSVFASPLQFVDPYGWPQPTSLLEWCVYPVDVLGHFLPGILRMLCCNANIVTRRAYNALVAILRHPEVKGNCSRTGTLPPLDGDKAPVVRTRNVDVPMPAVIVAPPRIPTGGPPIALAVDPVGMNWPDFLQAVQDAYNASPQAYPNLTPGFDCFWASVASLGGTPHMWYSWWNAFCRHAPDPNAGVYGPVDQANIAEFAAVSGIGVSIRGVFNNIINPGQPGYPVLHLETQRGPGNLYHIVPVQPEPVAEPVSNLARIFRTIRNLTRGGAANPWWNQIIQDLNGARINSVAKPSDYLLGIAGDKQLPTNREDVVAAAIASDSVLPITQAQQDGFSFNLNAIPNPAPQLYSYSVPGRGARFAHTDSAAIWKRFRGLANNLTKSLRLKMAPETAAMVDAKFGANAEQQVQNARRDNVRPDPPLWVTLRNELASQVSHYRDIVLPEVTLQEELLSFKPDLGRASRLVADLKAHPSVLGPRADPVTLQALDSIVDMHRLKGDVPTIPVRAYFGVSGCGKTTATIQYLKTLTSEQRSQVRIVSHTESLRAQAKQKLDFGELRGYNFPTLPSILTEPSSGAVVFDDAGKFYGGVLDLVALTNPLVTEFVVNGDPAQGLSNFPVAGTQSQYDPSAAETIAMQATKYATVSHRLFRLLANTLGVYTTSATEGFITHTSAPKVGVKVSTASPRYAGVLSGAGRQAYTYETVQGEDFDEPYEIDMTGLEGAVLDRTAYVALTRSKAGVYLHMDAADPTSRIRSAPSGSDLINALVYAMRESNTASLPAPHWLIKAVFYRHLAWCMPRLPWFAKFGATVPVSEYQSIMPASEFTKVNEPPVGDAKAEAHFISAEGPLDAIDWEPQPWAKEHREAKTPFGLTDQFKEDGRGVNPHVHNRRDTPTYQLSIQHRLKKVRAGQNRVDFEANRRQDMCDEFDRLVPNPPKLTPEKFNQYMDQAIDEYASKRTAQQIRAKLSSHDPDRRGEDILISLKNQVIKKAEKKVKIEAIPGQLIHEFDLSVTLNDAPYALFLENELVDAFPPQFLFYRRMSPKRFVKAYKARWRANNGAYSSDVTRWDGGCDAAMLNFDVHVMRKCRFPEDYVEAYIERRLNSRSQHGPMATMQNSGDRYTWILNSIRRAVVTSIVCDVQPEDTCAVNGDDAAIDRFCNAKPFPDSPWVFKDDNAMRVEFSGFQLGGDHPRYDAEGILYRTQILVSRDPSAQDKWVNYLDLLGSADTSSSQAMSVVTMAKQYMRPELFAKYLPKPFHFLL